MKEHIDLEILISTMNRKDLFFLDKMFPKLDTSLYSLLIINQTVLKEDLISKNPKIRVVNSREFGLSKSRNLAIENAKGDVLLLADDDIEYLPGFEKTILKAYQDYPEASLISFQFLNENKKIVKTYPKNEGYLKSTKKHLTSFEMSFRSYIFMEYNISFDERFGIGSLFLCAEEQVLRYSILRNGLKVVFVPQAICIHPGQTTGETISQENMTKATTAFKYIQYNNFVYIWLIKYVFYLFRHKHVSFFELLETYKIGMKAISELKSTTHED